MGTGLIYAAIVAAWAAYLVPLWLRRRDEAIAERAAEELSGDMRVLERRTSPTPSATKPASEPRVASRRRAGRTPAARRRRTLFVLLLATTTTAVLAALRFVPWWAIAIPAGLIVGFLLLSVLAVRHARRRRTVPSSDRDHRNRTRRANRTAPRETAGAADARMTRAEAAAWAAVAAADEAPPEERRTASFAASRPDGVGAEGQLWDPTPVPLPTYVSKAKAPRTVRTIDLSVPATWTSGRGSAPEGLSRPTDPPREVIEAADVTPGSDRRAVGD